MTAANKAGKPIILEEFGVGGLRTYRHIEIDNPSPHHQIENKTDIYPKWVQRALDTKHAYVIPSSECESYS